MNNETINRIVWWIPNRKMRDSVRNCLHQIVCIYRSTISAEHQMRNMSRRMESIEHRTYNIERSTHLLTEHFFPKPTIEKHSVALIIIYNHRYDGNINRLDKMYGNRFKHIFHLVPFYDGAKENVIPVFENSHFFQGYIPQGLKDFYDENFDHYFFIGDDLLLNPIINEANYKEHLSLTVEKSFVISAGEIAKEWPWTDIYLKNYDINKHGVEVSEMLPSFEEANNLINRFGIDATTFTTEVDGLKHNFKYPMVAAVSDMFIVSTNIINQFANYCAAFAVTEMFVEAAIPTTFLLTNTPDTLVMTKDTAFRLTTWAFTYIRDEDIKNLVEAQNNNLTNLLNNFPKDYLFIHPIKLSQWSD